MLTQARVKELFDYHPDGYLMWKVRPARRVKIGDVAGWNNGKGYIKVRVDKKKEYLHRLVYIYHHGYLPEFIDHKNGNPSDNTIENLREVTREQNNFNKNKQHNNKTGVKGVHLMSSGRYLAVIGYKNKVINLGTHDNIEDAALAYNKASERLFGEFARCNAIEVSED